MSVTALASQVESGIRSLLADDDIDVEQFDFYHVTPADVAIWMVTATDQAVFTGATNLETGEGQYIEFPADELAQVRSAIEAASPGAQLRWIGQGDDGEIALYQKADGMLDYLKIATAEGNPQANYAPESP